MKSQMYLQTHAKGQLSAVGLLPASLAEAAEGYCRAYLAALASAVLGNIPDCLVKYPSR